MKRREVITLLGGAAAAWPLAAGAQQTAKVAQIARLHPGSASDAAIGRGLRAFQDGLRALGHIEEQTYRLEARYAEGNTARLPLLAAELVALKPDVIVAVADDAVRAANAATASIPIVMAMSTCDPIRAGYIASFARPGRNVTGFTGQVEELNTKQLELLHELVPGLTNVAVMYNSGSWLCENALAAGLAGDFSCETAVGLLIRTSEFGPVLEVSDSSASRATIAGG